MGGSKKCSTVGYWYGIGIHFVPCVDADSLLKIRVAEKDIVSPNIYVNPGSVVEIDVNEPNAFGGESKEGGVVGKIDVQRGGATLPVNPYLASHQAPCPAYRSVFSIILKRPWVQAMNPFLKKWAFLLRRAPMNDSNNLIGDDANPAYIIWELLSNRQWGLGLSNIDTTSFYDAADTLNNEGFGLSFRFSSQAVLDMIREVARHIDAVVYLDMQSQQYKIKLIRDDYVVSDLPILSESDIIKMHEISRPDWNSVPNNLVVEWTNIDNARTATVSVQDLGSVLSTGKRTKRVEFHGATRQDVALMIAHRELKKLTALPISVDFEATQAAFTLKPGDVFNLNWTPAGIEGAIMRVGEIQYSETGTIRVKAVQDIFSVSMVGSDFVSDTSAWQDPAQPPSDPQHTALIEAPYLSLAQALSPAELNALLPESSFIQPAVAREAGASFGFDIKIDAPIDLLLSGFGNSPIAVFSSLVIPKGTTTTFDLSTADYQVDFSEVAYGDVLAIYDSGTGEHELCVVTSVSWPSITVARGAYDTTLNEFQNGVYLIKFDEFIENEFTLGDLVRLRFLPKTSIGTLDEAQATQHSISLQGRQYLPLCPANFKFNGSLLATSIQAGQDLYVNFANRNRITGATFPPAVFTDGNQTPESGQDTMIEYYNITSGVVIATHTVTGGGTTDILSASELPQSGEQLRIRAWSERGGEQSFQTFEWVLSIT